MKKTFALTIFLLAGSVVFGQNIQPLIIKGQLTDCPEKFLKIFFEQKDGSILIDTIHLDKNGRFYLKTFKIKSPQRTNIQQNQTQINNIFVAPGYNLSITANAKDLKSLLKTTKIKGIGAEVNAYKLISDSVFAAKNDTTHWFELNDKKLLTYVKANRELNDSVLNIAFKKKPVHDPYFSYFRKMAQFDNMFMELYFLVTHVNINHYGYDRSVAFVKNNFDNNMLNHICKDEYLISPDYRTWVIGKEYLNYLVNLDYLKDSTLRDHKNYKLEKAGQLYTGKVKDYVLYKLITGHVTFTKSLNDLNTSKSDYKSYVSAISNPLYRNSIDKLFSEKEAEILKTSVGKPAPAFTLQNSIGKAYSLSDFKGKVVYLDLWASWCEPCRAETPSLKALYSKYKNDNRIAFISIAVSDGKSNWQKALDQDKPDWVQLIDKDGMVSGSYVATLIPQFVIIDKMGNIVNFNAPAPSNGHMLEDILIDEMAR